MGLVLLLLFFTVPIIEIAVFIRVGDWIGLWPTLGLVILTAILGSWQLRRQGMATIARARRQLDQGEIPAKELFDGICLLGAGALLLTPGFVTDLAGASLFLPPVRVWLRRQIGRYVETRARAGGTERTRTRVFVNGEEITPDEPAGADTASRWGRRGARAPGSGSPGTIEGEWSEVRDDAGGDASGEALPGPDDDASDDNASPGPGSKNGPKDGGRR